MKSRQAHNLKVGGLNPSLATIIMGGLVQLARTSHLHCEGRGFETHTLHTIMFGSTSGLGRHPFTVVH